jgi:hypothetical protein
MGSSNAAWLRCMYIWVVVRSLCPASRTMGSWSCEQANGSFGSCPAGPALQQHVLEFRTRTRRDDYRCLTEPARRGIVSLKE